MIEKQINVDNFSVAKVELLECFRFIGWGHFSWSLEDYSQISIQNFEDTADQTTDCS